MVSINVNWGGVLHLKLTQVAFLTTAPLQPCDLKLQTGRKITQSQKKFLQSTPSIKTLQPPCTCTHLYKTKKPARKKFTQAQTLKKNLHRQNCMENYKPTTTHKPFQSRFHMDSSQISQMENIKPHTDCKGRRCWSQVKVHDDDNVHSTISRP